MANKNKKVLSPSKKNDLLNQTLDKVTSQENIANENTGVVLPFVNNDSLNQLKKASLLFNKVTLAFKTSLPRAKRARFPLSGALYSKDDIARIEVDLDYIQKSGLLNSPESDPIYTGFEMDDYDSNLPVWIIRTDNGSRYSFQTENDNFGITDMSYLKEIPSGMSTFLPSNVLQNPSKIIESKPTSSVIDIVLNNFPEPSSDTPWETIINWRNDEESRIKLARLKHWINTISQKPNSNIEYLNDEIQHLMNDYTQHMHVHDMKTNSSTLRAIVTTVAEILEDTVKLKLKKLADLPFRVTERKILKLEADLKAPGRELAYIIESKNKFQ